MLSLLDRRIVDQSFILTQGVWTRRHPEAVASKRSIRWRRGIGSPLLTSPEYNKNNAFGFKNNRVSAYHLGFQGYLSKQHLYHILVTSSENWGTMLSPFLKKKNNLSCAAKITYCHPRLEDWIFSGEVAADFGSLYGNTAGIIFSIKKTGILK